MANTDCPVAIIMGSQSDWPTMKNAADILDTLGVGYEAKIISATEHPTAWQTLPNPPGQTASR